MCVGGGGGGRGGEVVCEREIRGRETETELARAHACLFPSVLRLDSLSMHCIYVAVATRSSGI